MYVAFVSVTHNAVINEILQTRACPQVIFIRELLGEFVELLVAGRRDWPLIKFSAFS